MALPVEQDVVEDEVTESEPSLRDDLSAAFEAAQPADADVSAEPAERAAEGDVSPEAPRTRDEAGRFAKAEKAAAAKAAKATQSVAADPGALGATPAKVAGAKPAGVAGAAPVGQPVPAQESVPGHEKAPQSWKPGAREHWAALPADVKAEVHRREADAQRIMQETAPARQFAQQFSEAVRPYEAMIRAEGSDPLRAFGALLRTAAQLRTGPQGLKAQLVAGMVRDFGVDITQLDQALAGGAPQGGQQAPPPQPMQDPRVEQLFAEIQQAKQSAAQRAQQESLTEVERFGADREWFEDVRGDMANLLEAATRSGRELTLDQAYQAALAINPDIAPIVQQRQAAQAARSRTGSTQRARVAASSIRSNPASAAKAPSGDDLRSALLDAWDENTGA